MSEPPAATSTTTTNDNTSSTIANDATRTDQNNDCSVKVKSDFILDKRASSLGDVPPAEEVPDAPKDDRDRNSGSKRGGRKNKRNKKRPRDQRTPNSEKVCLAVVRGGTCPYGPTCKFSHDLQEYLKTRPADLTTLQDGCPNYKESGYCLFGAMCRFGACHLIKATGENLRKEGAVEAPPVKNNLSKDVIVQLRKRSYPFKCERVDTRNNKKDKDKESKASTTDSSKDGKTAETMGSDDVKKETNGATADNSQTDSSVKMEDAADSGTVAVDLKKEENTESGVAPTKKEEGSSNSGTGDAKKEETAAGLHFKSISDPFRPSQAAGPSNYNSSTPLPSKTKKIIDFSNKVYVAPLTTVGNLPFRRIMKRFGADITCGEMAVAGNLLDGKPGEWALLKRHPEEDIFGVQIASGYPDQFTRVCEVIENHLEVDFVDMNLGCPLDIICNKGAGSALMLRDKKLKGILEGITGTLSCPVTVKMRTGWADNKPFAHELVSKIQSWGLDGISAVMIHGRSRLQRYSKRADWDYISQVAQGQDENASKLTIIGNGDIFSYTEYEEKIAREGLSSAAMLGRGALMKPWLPTEIKERRHWDISATERLDMLKDFVRFGLTHWGSDQQGVDNVRRFLLEWLSFLYRYVPVGLLEVVPQEMNQRLPKHMCGRSDLETLFLSPHSQDWVKISEMLLGPVPDGFRFEPKHKAKGHQ